MNTFSSKLAPCFQAFSASQKATALYASTSGKKYEKRQYSKSKNKKSQPTWSKEIKN
jgi:hypothetical protein